MSRKTCVVTFIIFLNFCLSQKDLSAEKIKIGALHFPPFYSVESHKKVSGYFVSTLKEIFEYSNLEYEFNCYPPKRLYKNLADGKVDVWMGTKGVSLYEGKTLVIDRRIADIDLMCYWIGKEKEVESIEDLKRKKIITILGYNYGGLYEFLEDTNNSIIQDKTSTHELAFKKLEAGRANYLLNYRYPSEVVLKTRSIPDLKSFELKKIGIYIHISKKAENSTELKSKLEKAVVELKKAGKI